MSDTVHFCGSFFPSFLSQCMTIPIRRFIWFKQNSVETTVSRMVKCLLVICFTAAVLLCQKRAAVPFAAPQCAPLLGPGNAQSCAVSQGPVANFSLVGTGTIQVL